jgi:hypothetical protein
LKKLSVLFVAFVLLFGLSTVKAQPQVTIHLTGGYNLPMPDLKGDITDSADRIDTYGMKMGYGFGADGKYYLGKKRNVGITLYAGYQLFQNSEDTVTGMGKDIKLKLNAFNLGLGIEYAFLPKGKANPFIGAEFTGHFFSGSSEGTINGTSYSYTLKSASRFGAAFGAGVDIKLSKSIGIIIGGKYHLANLIGKDYDSSIVANEYKLNDKEYTVGNTTIAAKNISYIQGYLGISFYLNQPKKTVKK